MPPGVSCPQPPAPSPPPKRPRAACASAPSLDAASPGRLRARPRPAQAPNRPGVSSRSCSLRGPPGNPPAESTPSKPPSASTPDACPQRHSEKPRDCADPRPRTLSLSWLPAVWRTGVGLTWGDQAHMRGIRLTHGGRAPACAATLPGTPNPQILPARDLGRGFPCCPLCLATPTRLSPPLRLRTQPHHASSGEPPLTSPHLA